MKAVEVGVIVGCSPRGVGRGVAVSGIGVILEGVGMLNGDVMSADRQGEEWNRIGDAVLEIAALPATV